MKVRFQNTRFVIIASVLTLLNFFILIFLKYHLNDLSYAAYRFDYVGNILNIMVSSILFAGFIVTGYRKKVIIKSRMNLLIVLQMISFSVLIIIFIISKLVSFDNNNYFFTFPIKKVLIGFLFITSILSQLYSLIYVWGIILGLEKLYEVRTLIRTIFAVLILVIFSLFYVWNVKGYYSEKFSDDNFEYGLIPGAAVWSKSKPSPLFEGRIRKALELYRKGIVKNIVVTGGNAPGEITEADAAFNYLTNLGVDKENLIIERTTSTTTEQIKFLKFDSRIGILNNKVLIVSDGFHLSRILQMCTFFKVKAIGISSDYNLSFEKALFYRTRESIALLLFWFFAI